MKTCSQKLFIIASSFILILSFFVISSAAPLYAQLSAEDQKNLCDGLQHCVELLEGLAEEDIDTDEEAGCAALLAFSKEDLARCGASASQAANTEEFCKNKLFKCKQGPERNFFVCRDNQKRPASECLAELNAAADACEAKYAECIGKDTTLTPATPPPVSKPNTEQKPEPEKERAAIPEEVRLGLLNEDCSVNDKVFDRDWEKYSDIDDDRIPPQSRSYEAQQSEVAKAKIVENKLEIFLLKRDMEIGRQARLEMRAYREALVKNIKVNLIKSFIRLSYITYNTIKGGVGTGQAYNKLFSDEVTAISKLGSTLKVLRDLTPGDSQVAINTQTIRGKVQAVGTTAALEALESLGNPTEIGKVVAQDIRNQIVPSPDLTPEEIEILRSQHLTKRALDDALQESYRANFERRDRVEQLEAEITEFGKEADGWKEKEKERIAKNFQRNCREQLKNE